MKKNRPRKRTLTFERLETKSVPAALLVALAPVDDVVHEKVESAVQNEEDSLTDIDTSGNWQFRHSVFALLRFVQENTQTESEHCQTCSPPTWDQCRASDDMMQLKDSDLRRLVIAENFGTDDSWVS